RRGGWPAARAICGAARSAVRGASGRAAGTRATPSRSPRLFERSEPKVSEASCAARPAREHRSGVGEADRPGMSTRRWPPGAAPQASTTRLRLRRRTPDAGRPTRRCTPRLVRLRILEHQPDRAPDDVQVEAQRPLAQVLQVVADASLHVLELRRLASRPVDLGPAGAARPDPVAAHVA